MFKECQKDNVLMFPQKQQAMERGTVILSAREDGDVRINTKGLSPREIRSVLCVAIQASYKFEEKKELNHDR